MASAWFRRRQRAEAPDAVDVIGLPYLRVSSGKQERGYSPEAQRREIAAYIRRMGWEPGPEYRDTDRGTKLSRSDYQRLLTDAQRLTVEGRRVAIVSVALDRYGRNLEEQLRSKRELAAQGASLHFTREGGELDDDGTIMRGWMAQKEVQKLGERVSASKRVVADMGLPPSGPAPWGYRWRLPQTAEEERLSVGKAVRRVLVVDEREAPAVRTLFARAASGETLGTLARWVATLDDVERGARVLKRSAIGRVLRSGVYVARYSRDVAVATPEATLALPIGAWAPLVKDDVWLAVQRRLDSHTVQPRQASGGYLLTGYLFCPDPDCGRRWNAWTAAGRQPRYRCMNGVLGATTDERCYASADLAQVDAAVLAQVGAVLDVAAVAEDPDLLADVRAAWDELHTPATPSAQRVRQLDADIAKLRNRVVKAREDLYDEEIDQAEYDAVVGRARAALAEKEARWRELEAERQRAAPAMPFDEVLAKAGTWGMLLRSERTPVVAKRDVLAELIERVEPAKIAFGRYTANIVRWTDTGDTLRKMAEHVGVRTTPEPRRRKRRTTSHVRIVK